jgi:hypothetical protein
MTHTGGTVRTQTALAMRQRAPSGAEVLAALDVPAEGLRCRWTEQVVIQPGRSETTTAGSRRALLFKLLC